MWLWYMEACGGVGGKGVLTFTRVQNQREFLLLLRGSQQQGSYSQGIPLQCPLLHLLTQFSPLREWKHSLKATWLWTWLQRARQTAPSMGWVFTLRCENLWTATMLGLYEDLPPTHQQHNEQHLYSESSKISFEQKVSSVGASDCPEKFTRLLNELLRSLKLWLTPTVFLLQFLVGVKTRTLLETVLRTMFIQIYMLP